ncbi:MAG: peptide deformylase, partial [Planctomycetaceae bacterium]|nr:peptide deformylase [Planctomycetaceae bacterium]
MQIVPFPHPALSYKSSEVKQIDASLRKTIAKMFELMYQANGIGLAANQVGLPFRFFIVNIAGRKGESDEELVLINQEIVCRKGQVVG